MSKVTVTLPRLVCVTDYHEFDQISDTINDLLDKRVVRVKEIGFARGDGYVGVVYTGRRPNAAQLKELCTKHKIDLEEI